MKSVIANCNPSATRNVVQNHRKIGCIRDHSEVGENSSLSRLVVIRRDNHYSISSGFFAGLIELNRMGSLVGSSASDDLGSAGRDRLANFHKLNLLRIGESRCLSGGTGDHDAVGSV